MSCQTAVVSHDLLLLAMCLSQRQQQRHMMHSRGRLVLAADSMAASEYACSTRPYIGATVSKLVRQAVTQLVSQSMQHAVAKHRVVPVVLSFAPCSARECNQTEVITDPISARRPTSTHTPQ